MNWIDSSIGTHGQALSLWAKRAEVIAGNIANADTPRYRARDVEFASMLSDTIQTMRIDKTHSRHIGLGQADTGRGAVYERESTRQSSDGNSVAIESEQAAYAENAVRFQASAQFFDGGLRGLRKAFRGE